MKKTGLLALLILLSFSLYGTDRWSAIGFQYSHYFDSSGYGDDGDSTNHIRSKGITLSSYRFKEENNWGLFTHASLISPIKDEKQSYESADTRIITSFFIGPGFRGPVYRNLFQPFGGGGFHFLQFIYHDTFISEGSDFTYFQFTRNFGLGGEIGCRLNFTENFSLAAGTMIAWDFYSKSSFNNDGSKSSLTPAKYNALMLSPFLTLGYSTNLK
ncbi:MAG: hypothetical protein B6241_13905 [Spirochaetaceae bacterium 4572_59]|nr:MAG: hypothetical protein B6241_13905 [Spirochaetaceae bacterium 4572_59]